MIDYNIIKDHNVRNAIRELDDRLKRIEDIPQIPSTTSLQSVIGILNKITDNIKRRR